MAPTRRIVETPLQCSTDDFYKFFKEEANHLPNVCGSIVQKIELCDGKKSWVDTVGSRKRIYIVSSADASENIKYAVVALDNFSKKITFNVLEGAMLQFYSCFRVTFEVTVASTAKWTVEYETKGVANQEPAVYLQLPRSKERRNGITGESSIKSETFWLFQRRFRYSVCYTKEAQYVRGHTQKR